MFIYILYAFIMLIIALKTLDIFMIRKFNSSRRIDGQVVIITGSSRGIGKYTAIDLAKRGAKVIIASSNIEGANKARDEIIRISGNSNIEAHQLDLGSFKSIRKFANVIVSTEERLDVLINNAGIAVPVYKKSEDGLSLGLQVNHFGHFLLTNLLIDLLKKSAPSRIVHVTSLFHLLGKLDLDNLHSEKVHSISSLYSNSKLYNVLSSNEFARRLDGTGVTSNCAHPGAVKTEIYNNIFLPIRLIIFAIGHIFFKTQEEGAQTSIYLAVSDEVTKVSGKYFLECKKMNILNRPYSIETRKMFWDKCCDLVGLKLEERSI